ncbi:hypothetical protein BDV97DRAFT_370631 [Delphinella strobiligena]|nr:hypothetical protein BDV97DRAFT_370631 [Delphinella strobiligena]
MTSTSGLLGHGVISDSKNRQSDRKPCLLQKRFRLPWLDGNVNTREMPGDFDNSTNAFIRPSHLREKSDRGQFEDGAVVADDVVALQRTKTMARPFCSLPSLPGVVRKKSRQYSRSYSSLADPPTVSSYHACSPIPGHWPTMGGQAQYTPSSYSTEPPSEIEMPSHLSGKGSGPYCHLVVKPVEDRVAVAGESPKPPMWPMVPLSETEIPLRVSSLTFEESLSRDTRKDSYLRASQSAYELRGSSPSSIGRYNDGTISRKPTMRASAMQARLDKDFMGQAGVRRAATGQQLRSPDVSPKSAAPPQMPYSTAGSVPTQDPLSLQRAVTRLNDLMQEALSVATGAAETNQTHEVAQILHEATIALRDSNTVQGRMSTPLRIPDAETDAVTPSSDDYMSDSDSEAYVESETSSIGPERPDSGEYASTNYTSSRPVKAFDPLVAPVDAPLPLRETQKEASYPEDKSYHPNVSRRPTINPPILDRGKRPRSEHATFSATRDDALPSSSSGDKSLVPTPPDMYHQPSAGSVTTDWAYVKRMPGSRALRPPPSSESLMTVISPVPIRVPTQNQTRLLSRTLPSSSNEVEATRSQPLSSMPVLPRQKTLRTTSRPSIEPSARSLIVPRTGSKKEPGHVHISRDGPRYRPGHGGPLQHLDVSRLFESSYYNLPDKERDGLVGPESRHHISLQENQPFRLHKYRRQPIAREWSIIRKRVTATIACLNTALIGFIAGIYAGEVPKIQYQLADQNHRVILGNVLLYLGMGLATMFSWTLPLLHGRKPYTLGAFAVALPLNFPQAIVVGGYKSPETRYFVGLLLPRAFMGLALGFANVNFLTTLLDMFGASLMTSNPHQEIVVMDDIRRQGGGMGLWLGVWAWCFVGSLSIGFLIGAEITAHLDAAWGFYIVIILIASFMLVNVVAPEPRRRSDSQESRSRRSQAAHLSGWAKVLVGRSSCWTQAHVAHDAPTWIFRAGLLPCMDIRACGSCDIDYQWPPQFVGLAVFTLAFGALLAVPSAKANLFSRDRKTPPRTDSMTFHPRITWTSHLLRRCIFTFALPIAGLAYALASPGPSVSWAAPLIFSGLVGFLSCLAVAECIGLIMETYDTSDLQPGVNTKHRLQSMESPTRRRRTNYSSFPRVAAGFFSAQTIGFFLAAIMTAVSGTVTRALGSQAATGVVVGVLLVFTMLLSIVLWRFKSVQVIPNHALGTARSSHDWQAQEIEHDPYFKPVIIGNPSGKIRRMNILETGTWTRWTEIRKLNKLIKHKE